MIILCNELYQNNITLDDLSKQMTRNISKDGVISLKPIRISKGTADAIELIQDRLQENPDFSKTIYVEFLKLKS